MSETTRDRAIVTVECQ